MSCCNCHASPHATHQAKAWVLAVLGTVVAYDLTQTSEDPWSLRVYRGPALVAFTISCVAASLRIWRRSGVACDELLFLPGTPMACRGGRSICQACPDGQVRSVARRPVRAENMLFSVPRRLGRRHWWGCRTANSRLAPAEVATRITASAVTLLKTLGRCEVGVAVPISVPCNTVEVYSETRSIILTSSTRG